MGDYLPAEWECMQAESYVMEMVRMRTPWALAGEWGTWGFVCGLWLVYGSEAGLIMMAGMTAGLEDWPDLTAVF